MTIPLERKKTEALERMKLLGIFPEAIRQFEQSGQIMISEPPYGALYWTDDDLKERVRKFEETRSAIVYLVVHSYAEFGEMYSLLYVSDYEEEWKLDRQDIADGFAMTYTINLDNPDFSEFGSIGFDKRSGGLVRIS